MADINLKQVVHNVKEALIEKGVTDTITYGNINQIVLGLSGEGKKVINIEAIDANTVEVSYEDDTILTVAVEYDDDGKIIKLNGVNAVYDGDNLVRFGSADIDIEEIPGRGAKLLDHTVTFMADGQQYTIVSVTGGQSVFAPSPNPTSESGSFVGWNDGTNNVTFPYTPSADIELTSVFASTFADKIYAKFGVDKAEYPQMLIFYSSSFYSRTTIYFGKTVYAESNIVGFKTGDFYYYTPQQSHPSKDNASASEITDYLLSLNNNQFTKYDLTSNENVIVSNSSQYNYANIDMPSGALTSNWHDMRVAE